MEAAMRNDPDIRLEARTLEEAVASDGATAAAATTAESDGAGPLPLNVIRQAHRASERTAALAHAAGGLTVLRDMATRFYKKAFADTTLDAFIRSHDDPHGLPADSQRCAVPDLQLARTPVGTRTPCLRLGLCYCGRM